MNRLRTNPRPALQLRDALRSDLDALPDAELLDRFARYADHPAFEALLRRHGAMVFGVCRRMLAGADADDAFQATFLVLIRKARAIRGGRLGPWLYGVAYRVALKARSRAARFASFRTEATDMIPDPTSPSEVPDWLPILDAELAALPAKYRDPLVLCELQGATRADAARALGVPEGTLSSRLARGRELLRRRLLKHGTLLPASGLAALFSANGVGRATVAAALVARTSELAKVATGAAPAGAVPVGAAQLTDEVLKSMFLTKLRATGAALAALALAAVGLAGAALPSDAPSRSPNKGEARAVGPDSNNPMVFPQPGDKKPAAVGPTLPDHEALQGFWVHERFEILGKQPPAEEVLKSKELARHRPLLIAGNTWWLWGGPNGSVTHNTAVIDASKNPKWLDLRGTGAGSSGHRRCIYELDGDTLRICSNRSDGDMRPAEFVSDTETSLEVTTLRRGKLPPAAGDKAIVGSWVGEPYGYKADQTQPDRMFAPRVEVLDGYLFVQFPQVHPQDARPGWIGGKYTVDATKNPKWVDVEFIEPFGPLTITKMYGSYEAVDGGLKLRLGNTRTTRPLEFKSGNGVESWDLKPAKPGAYLKSPPPGP